ncbi:MAG: prenyltransferase/squalene oxidase repeat-containing protein [Planctomycetota bacterium]
MNVGLFWLASHQSPDGGWRCRRFADHCKKGICTGAGYGDEFDVGVTGLATLAFLGAGHTHKTGTHKWIVRRALRSLILRQTPDGCFGKKSGAGHWIYNHAVASAAVAEAYGLTRSPLLQGPAQKGIDFLVDCQNPYLGWRYGRQTGENDTSVTGWATMALVAAKASGLHVPRECFHGALNWMNKVTEETYYKTGYVSKGDTGWTMMRRGGPDYYPTLGKFQPNETNTAVAVVCKIFMLGPKSVNRLDLLGGGGALRQNLPRWTVGRGTVDMHYWYFGSMAMFQLGRTYWRTWNRPLLNALLPTQVQKGCELGSWSPVGACGLAGGRVYATAINVLTLETYYRYSRVYE